MNEHIRHIYRCRSPLRVARRTLAAHELFAAIPHFLGPVPPEKEAEAVRRTTAFLAYLRGIVAELQAEHDANTRRARAHALKLVGDCKAAARALLLALRRRSLGNNFQGQSETGVTILHEMPRPGPAPRGQLFGSVGCAEVRIA